MNKIVALTLTASIALASLTGCVAKDAQQKGTNVSGISNSEENDTEIHEFCSYRIRTRRAVIP